MRSRSAENAEGRRECVECSREVFAGGGAGFVVPLMKLSEPVTDREKRTQIKLSHGPMEFSSLTHDNTNCVATVV